MKIYLYLLAVVFLAAGQIYPQKLYWVDGPSAKVQSSNLDGSGISDLVTGIGGAFAVEADLTNSKLYWTDNTAKAIQRSAITGGTVTTIISQAAGSILTPRGIALDVAGNKIYWSDNGSKKIRRTNLDGTGAADVITGLTAPGYIAFDAVNNKLYYADNGTGIKSIYRCNTDGTGIQAVVTGLSQIRGIALNVPQGTIYWIDNGTKKIQKGSLSSLPVTKTDVLTNLSGKLRGLVIDAANNLMYWSDVGNDNIMRSTTAGASVTTLVSSVPFPQGLAINWNAESLPVELTSFEALSGNNKVTLKWQTATEINNYGFEVERGHEGMSVREYEGETGGRGDWEKIGFVAGHGNSNSTHEYLFTDEMPPSGNLSYRLKQIDNDGAFKYYDAVSVMIDAPEEYRLLQNSPNPFNPVTAIKFKLPENKFVTIKIYDQAGREVTTLVNGEKPAGSHIVYWNGKDNNDKTVSSGVYLYRLQAGSYVETRKMNLLK